MQKREELKEIGDIKNDIIFFILLLVNIITKGKLQLQLHSNFDPGGDSYFSEKKFLSLFLIQLSFQGHLQA